MPSALSLLERTPPTSAEIARMIDGYRVDQRPSPEPLLSPDVPMHDPDVLLMDHGWREEQPGYPAYASAAIKDLAPTPLDAATYMPGIGEAADVAAALRDASDGEYRGVAASLAAAAIPGVGAGVIKAATAPRVTVPAYRAHRIFLPGDSRYGSLAKGQHPMPLYPAMIGKDTKVGVAREQQIPMGEWLKSEFVPFQMAPRQGWHAGVAPYGAQFNKRTGQQPHNTVYSEVELGADVDYSGYTDPARPTKVYREGDALPFGDPATLPEGGFYLYQAPGGKAPWMVSDYVKHNRVISDEEIADRMRDAGFEPPPPRAGGPITEAKLKEWGLR